MSGTLTTAQSIQRNYQTILARTGAASEVSFWVNQINVLGLTLPEVQSYFATSSEALACVAPILQMYQADLGRAADSAGLTHWVGLEESGVSLATIGAAFAGSAESMAHNAFTPIPAPTAAWVSSLYLSMLGRGSDSAGLTYWVASGLTSAQIVAAFAGSAEAIAHDQAAVTLYLATISQTYTLTTGVDTITPTGNNNTINGTANGTGATFAPGDTINGGTATGDTINISDLGAGGVWTPNLVAGVTVSGVQVANLSSSEGVTINTSSTGKQGWGGLITLNVTAQTFDTAVRAVSITAAGTTAISLTATAGVGGHATGTIGTTGGSAVAITVNVTNPTTGTTTLIGPIGVTGVAGTVSVSVTQSAAVTTGAAITDAAVTITDANAGSATAAGSIATVSLNNYGASSLISSNALSNLSLSGTGGTLTITDKRVPASATTLNLTLDNLTGANTLTDTNHEYTTLAVTTLAAGSVLAGFTGFTAVTAETVAGASVLSQTGSGLTALRTIIVSGAAGLTDNTLASLAFLTSVASTSGGIITVSLDDTKTNFTGGTGQDIVTVTGPATQAITGGSALNNEIVFGGAAPASLANITKFSILGVNHSSFGTFNLGTLINFASLDVQDGSNTVTFANAPGTGTTVLAIDGNATSITYETSDTAGATDTLVLTLGGASTNSTSFTDAALITTDSAGRGVSGIANGIGIINITTNDTSSTGRYTITALTDTDLSKLTLSGSGALTIGPTALTDTVTILSIANNSTNSQASIITALTDGSLATLNISGSGATTISTLIDAGSSFTLADRATGAVAVTSTGAALGAVTVTATNTGSGSLTIAALTDDTATSETFNNSGSGSIAIGGTAHTGASVANLSLLGAVTYTATADAATTGVVISGKTDHNAVNLNLSKGAAGGATNSITLGNGANSVTDKSTSGTVNITVGTGANTIILGTASTVGTIILGTAATDTVVFGLHAATTADSVSVVASTSEIPTEVITGLNAAGADSITFLDDPAATGAISTYTMAANTNVRSDVDLVLSRLARSHIGSFQLGGNTYLVEQANIALSPFIPNTNTVVELIGLFNFTTASTAFNGILTLHG